MAVEGRVDLGRGGAHQQRRPIDGERRGSARLVQGRAIVRSGGVESTELLDQRAQLAAVLRHPHGEEAAGAGVRRESDIGEAKHNRVAEQRPDVALVIDPLLAQFRHQGRFTKRGDREPVDKSVRVGDGRRVRVGDDAHHERRPGREVREFGVHGARGTARAGTAASHRERAQERHDEHATHFETA